MARRPLERERVCLDGGRRTTQLMRDSLGSPLVIRAWIPVFTAASIAGCAAAPGPRLIDTSDHPTSCAGRSTSDTTIYELASVTEKPVLRRLARLDYPPDAQTDRRKGRVVFGMVINADGRVDSSSVTVLDPDLPSFEQAGRRALYRFLYWPACRAQDPVRVRVAIPLQWSIEADSIRVGH